MSVREEGSARGAAVRQLPAMLGEGFLKIRFPAWISGIIVLDFLGGSNQPFIVA